MSESELSKPEVPDYYAALGLQQEARSRNIKLAYMRLARESHPDKLAPGKVIDAHEFRKVRLGLS